MKEAPKASQCRVVTVVAEVSTECSIKDVSRELGLSAEEQQVLGILVGTVSSEASILVERVPKFGQGHDLRD